MDVVVGPALETLPKLDGPFDLIFIDADKRNIRPNSSGRSRCPAPALRGARARGVKVGDRIRDVRDAYPKAKVNRQTEDVFGVWLVRIPRNGGGRITFSVPVDTKRVDRIGVPLIPFCE